MLNRCVLKFLGLLCYLCVGGAIFCAPGDLLAAPNWVDVKTEFKLKKIVNEKLSTIGHVRAIHQEPNGYIWIGGSNGLARYDGYDVKIYLHDDNNIKSISTNSITDFLLDIEGHLWVATYWGLNRYDSLKDNFEPFIKRDDENSLSHNSVRCMALATDGAIWIGTDGGGLSRFEYKNKKFTHFKESHGLASTSIKSLHMDGAGYMWVGFSNHGLARFKPGTNLKPADFQYFSERDFFFDKTVIDISEDETGSVWIATHSALYRYNEGEGRFYSYGLGEYNDFAFIEQTTTDLTQDSLGRLWFTSAGRRLYRYHAETNSFTKTNRQVSEMTAVFADRLGGVWVGTSSDGIYQLDPYASSFVNYFSQPGRERHLTSSNVYSLYEDREQTLWVGTQLGFDKISLKSGGVSQAYPFQGDSDPRKGASVESITGDPEGNLWFSNSWWGVSRFNVESETYNLYLPENGVDVGMVNRQYWSSLTDSQNQLYFGSSLGWLHLYKPEQDRFEAIKVNPKFNANRIMVIFEDRENGLWLGADNGLYHRPAGQEAHLFELYDVNSSHVIRPSNQAIRSIMQDSQGGMWFGSHGGGLYHWDQVTDSFKTYTVEDGLPHNSIFAIVEDEQEFLWLATGNGLARFNPSNRNIRTYTVRYGLPGNAFTRNAALRLSTGELAFGGTHGLTIFNPQILFVNATPPEVIFTDFQLFNKSIFPGEIPESSSRPLLEKAISHTDKITLNHRQSVFTFQFAAVNFNVSELNQYAYILEGFDKDWTFSGTRRSATYTNLDPGDYKFKVRAANNEGYWNEQGVSIAVIVLPPWWQTWWAYGLYGVIAISIFVSIIYQQYRKRQIAEEQSRLLEVKVAERTEELRRKNDDIQCMLSNMRQGLFTINKNGKIDAEYSRYLESIFEKKDIAGQEAIGFLFPGLSLPADLLHQVTHAVYFMLGQDIINYEMNAGVLVTQYTYKTCEDKRNFEKYLDLLWNPIIEDGYVHKLMVTVRDKTLIRELEADAEHKRVELNTIAQLLELEPRKVNSFFSQSMVFINECENVIEKICLGNPDPKLQEEAISQLFRNLHTIKGNARTYGFTYISDAGHIAETSFIELRAKFGQRWLAKDLLQCLQSVRDTLQNYQRVFSDVLGRDVINSRVDGIYLNHDIVSRIRSSASPGELAPIDAFLEKAQSYDMENVLSEVVRSANSIAKQLGKPSPVITLDVSMVGLKPAACDLVTNVFSHLLRNCLDHGIESAQERLRMAKPECGSIFIVASEERRGGAAHLCIRLADDGRGLNVERLYQVGIARGYWSVGDALLISEIADSIFRSGVTTKEVVNDISGRGVGMDAVKQFIERNDGEISLRMNNSNLTYAESIDFVQFEIVIRLPSSMYVILPKSA